jgi:hypothetical protein
MTPDLQPHLFRSTDHSAFDTAEQELRDQLTLLCGQLTEVRDSLPETYKKQICQRLKKQFQGINLKFKRFLQQDKRVYHQVLWTETRKEAADNIVALSRQAALLFEDFEHAKQPYSWVNGSIAADDVLNALVNLSDALNESRDK